MKSMKKKLTKTLNRRSVERLAKELWIIGATVYFRKTGQNREPIWKALDPDSKAGWIVVARHVLKGWNKQAEP
jgi:hypothetical protein